LSVLKSQIIGTPSRRYQICSSSYKLLKHFIQQKYILVVLDTVNRSGERQIICQDLII